MPSFRFRPLLAACAVLAALTLIVVEDRIGHGDRTDIGDFHDAVDVLVGVLAGEELPGVLALTDR